MPSSKRQPRRRPALPPNSLRKPALDQLALLAARACGTTAGFVGVENPEGPRFPAWFGVDPNLHGLELFPELALKYTDPFVIEDIARDKQCLEWFAPGKPPRFRFYAGQPLFSLNGARLGTLGVLDDHPHFLTPAQAEVLAVLGRQIAAEIEHYRELTRLRALLKEHTRGGESLRNSEAFYRSLVDSLPQNIFRKDLEGRFIFANRRFCTTLGCSPEEILGKTDLDFFPRALAQKYRRDDERVYETLQPFETVEAYRALNGEKAFVHVVKTPLYDAQGHLIGLQGIFWDVTERKRVEEALNHERELLRTLMDNLPDAIYFKDVQSRFLRCSRAMADKYGKRSPEELVGKTDFDIFRTEHAQAAYEDEQRIIRTGQPVIGISEKETLIDGHDAWALTTKMPLRNRNGQIVGTFGVSKDITALKQAEAELASARDLALESARLKSEFLANMSHEIRTPMNGIIGMTGLLLETELNPQQRDFAQTIRTCADSLLNIINDILDFSKMEAGKLDIEIIDVDVREIVETTVELLAERAQRKDLELGCLIDHAIPRTLRGDPGRLRQILTNLVGNAVKFTDQGEVLVRAGLVNLTRRHVTIRFEVQDTGIGMSETTVRRIFQAFTQADGSTTRRFGGTGLGLAICRQLVKLMHGKIGVESRESRGSTFWFSVRLGIPPRTRSNASADAERSLAGLKVLIVDDNLTNRKILLHQTAAWKMHAGTVAGGPEALAELRQAATAGAPYDLVILDLQMPHMDGLAVAREITRDPVLAGIRLAMLTSLGQCLDREVLREVGIAQCLLKPVRQSRLYDCLADTLALKSHTALPTKTTAPAAPSRPVPVPKQHLRVLLAEDNSVNQKVALRQLQKLGYAAEAVADGNEVLEAVQEIPYDVILMDCQMPELDGYEATRRVRALEAKGRVASTGRPLYIVAMTANALSGDREKCLAAGMNAYISKPVLLPELESVLAQARTNTPAPSPFVTPPDAPPAVDPKVIHTLSSLSSDEEMDSLAELIDLFLRDASKRLESMRRADASRQPKVLTAEAHSLKGSANNMGARPLANLCAVVETCARDEDWPAIPGLLDRVQAEIRRVGAALEQEKAK